MQLINCPTGLQAGQSRRFAIREFILNLLKSDERLSLYKIVKNPKNPTALDDGLTIVFVDVSDGYVSKSSNDRSKRLYSFSLAVVSRSSEDAEAEADRIYKIVKILVRNLKIHSQKTDLRIFDVKEQAVQFTVENLDVDGAVIVGNYDLEYVSQAD